jgi:hypothetical protein
VAVGYVLLRERNEERQREAQAARDGMRNRIRRPSQEDERRRVATVVAGVAEQRSNAAERG